MSVAVSSSDSNSNPPVRTSPNPSLRPRDLVHGWWRVLSGHAPLLSIEITRECPLSCPGCYAYGNDHLGGGTTLSELRDFRGNALVDGVIGLVQRHKPLHVSLVGGEPMIRHRELDRILPALSELGVHAMVVTSGVIAIPAHWMQIPRLRIAVSVDGLPEHHDERRKPATYERILNNIAGRSINVHWVITRPMMTQASYLEEYVSFWSEQAEVDRIWVSLYSPQLGEESAERLTLEDRERIARELPQLAKCYPKLLIPEGMAKAFVKPPRSPRDCLFSRMSTNYSADLQTRVEPCVFGGNPDCSQCGCSISSALHWIRDVKIAGPLKIGHLVQASLAVGSSVSKMLGNSPAPERWRAGAHFSSPHESLIQIQPQDDAP
jgi:MoaA/NifB/PqqE/SkfB family radical SAM enzyme